MLLRLRPRVSDIYGGDDLVRADCGGGGPVDVSVTRNYLPVTGASKPATALILPASEINNIHQTDGY